MDYNTSFAVVVVALSAALVIALIVVVVASAAIAAALLRRRVSSSAAAAEEEKGTAAAAEAAAEDEEEEEEIRRCSWEEIERLTGNFTAEVVGVGGFSTVYRAINGGRGGRGGGGGGAVVKVLRSGGGERRRGAFALELELLRRLRHPNIVRLLAYCDDREEEGALVLEYAPNGTLHDRLHSPAASAAPLPWAARMRILYDVAGALAHLHSPSASASASASGPVVHGDVTSSNVLLGPLPRLRPLLCDFGSARVGFSASVAPSAPAIAVASPGYVDPSFLRTGILSKSSDVFSFGVLFLETLTGLPAVRSDGRNLTAEIAPGGALIAPVEALLDPTLRAASGLGFPPAEAAAAAEIAARCVRAQPSLRPSMPEVRALIRERIPSAISAADPESDGPDDHDKERKVPVL